MSVLKKLIPLELTPYLPYLAPRKKDTYKGNYGHVLIVGGHPGFSGAVRLAGEAALRTGAGLVSIATHPLHAALISMTRPELMSHGVHNKKTLLPLLEKATVIVIGPGLGMDAWSQTLLKITLSVKDKPILFDADALNLLAHKGHQPQPHYLYTPHPGEAAQLLKTTAFHIQSNRIASLEKLTLFTPGVVVLKGMHTLIGQRNQATYLSEAGNPGMATAGMGDVLTGMIAGLIAQNIPLLEAACLGVLIHAQAGDKVALKGMRGLIASDLFDALPTLLNPPCPL